MFLESLRKVSLVYFISRTGDPGLVVCLGFLDGVWPK